MLRRTYAVFLLPAPAPLALTSLRCAREWSASCLSSSAVRWQNQIQEGRRRRGPSGAQARGNVLKAGSRDQAAFKDSKCPTTVGASTGWGTP